MNAPEDIPEPTEIEALLPWHAAGTLDPGEKRTEGVAVRRPGMVEEGAAGHLGVPEAHRLAPPGGMVPPHQDHRGSP